jgi:hypothetical protein
MAQLRGKNDIRNAKFVLFEPYLIRMKEGRLVLAGYERIENGSEAIDYAQSRQCRIRGELFGLH